LSAGGRASPSIATTSAAQGDVSHAAAVHVEAPGLVSRSRDQAASWTEVVVPEVDEANKP
jgi:hypothetical protein